MTGQQLKNSILQMAVQGKLVPQDPNDEPASVLLERIRTEKEQLIKEGKIKKEKRPSIIFRGADNLPYEKVGKNEPLCIADEVPFEIPESWEWARLGMISTYSYTKKKINAQNADPKMWGLDLDKVKFLYGNDRYMYCLQQALIHIQSGNLIMSGKHLRLTRKGLFISDTIMSDLFYVD